MKTTDELVRELADREAIRDLAMRYCDYLYRNDLDGLVNLFTETGRFVVRDVENEVVTHGRAELKKMYQKLVREVQPRPLAHSHVVELRGATSASGRCYVEMRSAKIEMEQVGSGCWEDDYVKVGAQWKFASRRLIEVGITTSLRTFMVN
jgi:SnoaL-like domain